MKNTNIFMRWLISSLFLMVIPFLIPWAGIRISSFWIALIAALVLGLLNVLIRPFLLLVTLPINILTLGVFTLFVNASVFWLTSRIVSGFVVPNFWAAFWGAIIYSLLSMLINSIWSGSQTPVVRQVKPRK
ncbi:MAG: phage holin family protein [Candidatus Berkelbacteria bacterium]|nr:phage holin family protein [Candidatus Berkelbacteria bacterium]